MFRQAFAGRQAVASLSFIQSRRVYLSSIGDPTSLDIPIQTCIRNRPWAHRAGPSRFYSTGVCNVKCQLSPSHADGHVVVVHNRPRDRARRIVKFFTISTISFLVGAYLALKYSPPLLLSWKMGSLPTDEETLSMYEAPNARSREIDEHIKNCAIARRLRANPDFQESRPHLKIPEAVRAHNLTGGTLAGPGMIVVPPYIWSEKQGKELTEIFYVGNNVSGHPGIVHGGLLATMLDEGLARCCFAALPNKVGVTANLQINYLKPTKADQYLVLKAKTTKVEGRKAFVEGHIETMPEDGEEPEILVSATALFIEPKHAAVSATAIPGLGILADRFSAQMLKSLYRAT